MATEHFDVLVVGAGLSGVGAGYYLQSRCPGRTYAILEAREAIGGTWDLFRYPGIRSDSDMFTLGYAFRPWKEAKAIADGPSILKYVREAARDYGIDRHIRFQHRVRRAQWSSGESRWTVEVERGAEREPVTLSCSFLYMCSGYYDYDGGYTPNFAGMERFKGRLVHPQHWPQDLDYSAKRVVVIGSGATAVTLVPAMAPEAAHITMLQRSPSYVMTLPAKDIVANFLRRVLPSKLAYAIARWKQVTLSFLFYKFCRRWPRLAARLLKKGVRAELGPNFDVDKHFSPRYAPWTQRLCFVPDSDLFQAIRQGRASVVTDEIEGFTENGIKLRSGAELAADIVVTATGLKLKALGGLQLAVDGQVLELPKAMSYKGLMLSDVPNFAYAIGYTNASWTLKCDLTSSYVCRLLNHMQRHGYTQCTPRRHDPGVREEPLIDFSSGYVQRSIHEFPTQGSKAPWRLYQNYALDLVSLKFGTLDDETLEFSAPAMEAMGVNTGTAP